MHNQKNRCIVEEQNFLSTERASEPQRNELHHQHACGEDQIVMPGVHNAKAEECTCTRISKYILAWVGYIATKFAKNSPTEIS